MAYKMGGINFGKGTGRSPNKIVKHLGKAIPGLNAAYIGYEVYKHATRDRNPQVKKLSEYSEFEQRMMKNKFPKKYRESKRLERDYQEELNPELKEERLKKKAENRKKWEERKKKHGGNMFDPWGTGGSSWWNRGDSEVKEKNKNIDNEEVLTEGLADKTQTKVKNNKTKSTSYDKAYKNRDMKTYGKMSKAEYIKEAKRQKAIYDKTGKWDVKKQY